jgi:K+-transporting ATPase KdpF subunit
VEQSMSVMAWIGLVLAVALAIYLFAALMRPEKFE